MTTVLERDALYYPYIQVQSANWLKSTLLCFPHVRRIVPGGYWPNDQRSIVPFSETEGVGGLPLLVNESPGGEASSAEQARLALRINENADAFVRHFSQDATRRKYPATANSYRINYLKFDHRLREVLIDLNLVWEDEIGWFSLHPRLGRAVMATIAIAVANERGFDIVTNDALVHRSVCTQRQDHVFDELTGRIRHEPVQASHELVDELASIFISTYFDVSKLSIEQIVILQQEGKDLRRFKEAIIPIAQRIPDIPDLRERQRRLKQSAAEINNEWKKYKKSLPRFAVDAILDATEATLPAAASTVLGTATSTFLPFGVVAGLAVGFTSYTGWRMWQKHQNNIDSPYQYLHRVHRAGATLLIPTSTTVRP